MAHKPLLLIEAYIQTGEKPPYKCISIPVRMKNGMPQINVDDEWLDFPRDGVRPKLEKYHGHVVAGISSNWGYLSRKVLDLDYLLRSRFDYKQYKGAETLDSLRFMISEWANEMKQVYELYKIDFVIVERLPIIEIDIHTQYLFDTDVEKFYLTIKMTNTA